MYSPPAAPPNHQITTNMNPTPTEIQAADSIAASLVLISWASRWNTRRSISSRPTMRPSRTIHCQLWTVTSTKLPLRSAASTGVIVGALVPSVGSGPAEGRDRGPSSCSGESADGLLGGAGVSADDRLGGGPAGDRHAEGRAADVVEAGLVEQGDRLRVAAVLAAHAELELGLDRPTPLGADLHQFTNPVAVDRLERVALEQALFEVGGHHPALDIVAAEPERHLREVVGAEGEEVGLLGDGVGAQGGTRRLDHRADRDVGRVLHALVGAVDLVLHPAAGEVELLTVD